MAFIMAGPAAQALFSGASLNFLTRSASNSPKSATSRSSTSAKKAGSSLIRALIPSKKRIAIDYLRRHRFSLDNILRNWVNDPTVVLLFEGAAIAAQHPSDRVTLIDAQDESVTIFVDSDTHLPVKKSFSWRDPVDRQKNLEEEVYENYKPVSGVMAPYNITRFFNEDMASQRFLNSVTINQGLDEAMFDPNSGYNPNKPAGKQTSKR